MPNDKDEFPRSPLYWNSIEFASQPKGIKIHVADRTGKYVGFILLASDAETKELFNTLKGYLAASNRTKDQ